jgi:deazaflavin-dependent oxidoreductase (nitroreductase family)
MSALARVNCGTMAKTYQLGPALRAYNLLMKPLVRLGIGGKTTYLLTTTGRRTGRQRTTPVVLVENDGERWLVSPYGLVAWVHNVRAQPEVTLRHGRRAETLHVEEVDPVTAGPVLQRYVRNVRVTAPFFDAKGDEPVERFVEEAPRHPVFKLTATSP